MPATRKPLLLLLALTGCGNLDELFCEPEGCDWKPGEWARVAALANPGPPPPDLSNALRDHPTAQLMGQAFFFDPAFSGTATQEDAIRRSSPPARAAQGQPIEISCASCHDLERAGVDTTSEPGHVSVGAGWTDVNALPVVNSAYRPVVFWNGRADSLWALNVVVAESRTTLNGNRLRTAHLVAQNYLKTGLWPAEPALLAEFGRLLGREQFGCGDLVAAIDQIAAMPPDGKPGRPESPDCQEGDPREPFGDAYDCLPTAEQRKLVTSVLVIWAKAIAAYEYRLTSVDSPFDTFVREGPSSSEISAAAKRGARLFVGKAGCVDCHSGPHLTDDLFHNVAVPQTGLTVPTEADCPQGNTYCDCSDNPGDRPCAPWGAYDGLVKLGMSKFKRSSEWSDERNDASRDAYVKRELTEDLKGAWRTPSLRNVALTAPYMHDGRYATLEEVVWHYNTAGRNAGPEQVGVPAAQIKPLLLTEAEQADLVEFLRTLTGAALPEGLTAPPVLPPFPPLRCMGSGTGTGGVGGAGAAGGGPGASGAGGAGGGTGGSSTGTGGAGGAGMPLPVCLGAPPAGPLIADFSDARGDPIRVGMPPNITGHVFTFAAPGRTPPVVVVGTGANGTAALRVDAQTGTASDPSNGAFGFGLAFDACLDVSAYRAVRFTIGGTAANCGIRFGITSPPNVSPLFDSRGSCPLASCYPPAKPFPLPSQPGTVTLDLGGPVVPGSPDVVEARSVIGVQWLMDSTVGGPCDASLTIDDVSFVP